MFDQELSRAPLARVDLITEDEDLSYVAHEFPTITFARVAEPHAPFVIDDVAWQGAFELAPFDLAAWRSAIAIRGDAAVTVAGQALTRWQRHLGRTNAASATATFHELLRDFPYASPAERDRALDTWQWTLRLLPDASLALQVAAILRATEREEDEDGARRVPDGADEERVFVRARSARVEHGLARAAAEVARDAILFGAEALSFLSLESAAFADRYGVAQARRKISYLVKHMSETARAKLPFVRLRPDVDRLFARAMA